MLSRCRGAAELSACWRFNSGRDNLQYSSAALVARTTSAAFLCAVFFCAEE
ncbi:hypothetical protein GCWU000246_01076 [Jonquetella anthropi E3_33 E1]|nr:hypothetical protein GCWU000246_01076 [Jonquetella anthropi E3_33 E1]